MKKLPCKSPGCAEKRAHHERWAEPRGVQYVQVPDDWPDEKPVFCSMECAIYAGAFRPYPKPEVTK